MASSIYENADGDPHVGILISVLGPMAEDVLNDTWALVTGSNTASGVTEFTAKAAEFSSQLTEISLRISENKAKFETERSLQHIIHPVYKGFKDQGNNLMTWLKSRERADAIEDACLAGDSESAILIDLKTKAVRRYCQTLALDELMCRLHLADSTERMMTYDT